MILPEDSHQSGQGKCEVGFSERIFVAAVDIALVADISVLFEARELNHN